MKIRFGTLLSAHIQIQIGGKIWWRIDLDTPQGRHQTPWLRVSFGLDKLFDDGVQRIEVFVTGVSSSAWISSLLTYYLLLGNIPNNLQFGSPIDARQYLFYAAEVRICNEVLGAVCTHHHRQLFDN
jgi:hypothetical protein